MGCLQRDVDTNRELYNAILTRIKDVEMQGDIQSKNVSVINHAEVPGVATSPRKMLALMLATIGGLGLGLALAFIVEMSDNTLKNPEEAENYLKLPNLGVVPEFSSVNGKSAYAPRELLSGGGHGTQRYYRPAASWSRPTDRIRGWARPIVICVRRCCFRAPEDRRR